jgi:hypothetical protein
MIAIKDPEYLIPPNSQTSSAEQIPTMLPINGIHTCLVFKVADLLRKLRFGSFYIEEANFTNQILLSDNFPLQIMLNLHYFVGVAAVFYENSIDRLFINAC